MSAGTPTPGVENLVSGREDREDYAAVEVHETPRDGYPAEKRVADLERFLDAQRRRAEALHHARKSWGERSTEDPRTHATDIITIAQVFERFLADGTALPEPTTGMQDTAARRHAVMNAAMNWVQHAHLRNPAGLENWRNWSDEYDQSLINAVLAYRGMPPLERKAM